MCSIGSRGGLVAGSSSSLQNVNLNAAGWQGACATPEEGLLVPQMRPSLPQDHPSGRCQAVADLPDMIQLSVASSLAAATP